MNCNYRLKVCSLAKKENQLILYCVTEYNTTLPNDAWFSLFL